MCTSSATSFLIFCLFFFFLFLYLFLIFLYTIVLNTSSELSPSSSCVLLFSSFSSLSVSTLLLSFFVIFSLLIFFLFQQLQFFIFSILFSSNSFSYSPFVNFKSLIYSCIVLSFFNRQIYFGPCHFLSLFLWGLLIFISMDLVIFDLYFYGVYLVYFCIVFKVLLASYADKINSCHSCLSFFPICVS